LGQSEDDIAARVESRAPRSRNFGITPRFGAGYTGVADVGTWNLGLGLSYHFAPEVAIELRGDFLFPLEEAELDSALNSAWFALDLLWCFVHTPRFRSYIVAGVALAVVPMAGGNGSRLAGGGIGGVGAELFFTRWLAASLEVAGIVAGDSYDVLEGGVIVNLGLAFYL